MIALVVNGKPRRVDASPDSPLPRVIREERCGDGREHLLELAAARDHADHGMHPHRDYPMMRINEMRGAGETHTLDSGEAPGGPGELGVPPVAPAHGDAILAPTRQRIRWLPIRRA